MNVVSIKKCCALGRCVKTTELKACSACSETLYCSREHQVEHFKSGGHKMICPGSKKGEVLSFSECATKAHNYHEKGMWLASLPYYGAMLELTERVCGIFHFQDANILLAMVTCYKNLEKYEEASQCLQRILVIKELNNDDSAESNKDILFTMGVLGELYVKVGNLELAKEIFKKSDEAAKETFGESSFERGRILNALAASLEANNEKEDAETILRSAISLEGFSGASDTTGKNHFATALLNLGILLLNQNRTDEALIYLSRSMEIKFSCGMNIADKDIAELQDLIGRCHLIPAETSTNEVSTP